MIAAGALRHRVTYQEPTTSTDSFGQLTKPTLVERWSSWARVAESGSREVEKARQIVTDATHVVTLRGDRQIKPTGSFTWIHRGVTHHLEVESIAADKDGDGSTLTIICKETPPQ